MRIHLLPIAIATFLFMPNIAAAGDSYVAAAIAHSRAAIEAGKKGSTQELMAHASKALRYAEEAQDHEPNKNIRSAIQKLKESVNLGVKNLTSATRFAELAEGELEKAMR